MQLRVNGEAIEQPAGATVADLLAAMSLEPTRVAVERNRQLVRRATFADVTLAEGDELEVVTLVGGG